MSGIVGTAGHIDHGKTSLVRRLTGVDCDRLPEEKRRGITIALGFAPLDLPGGRRAGVVDVPGHERFVRTMVSGATGIDLALLVVAADEGVMPQTREHLEICGLLGVRRGVVALTKVDRAGPELTELARADVEELLEGTFLAGAPIFPCSAVTGDGIEALRGGIAAGLERLEPAGAGARFFLPVDRVLSVAGFGTVVTGTALSGELGVGDEVEVLPPPLGRRPIRSRVRSLQEFGRSTERIRGGHRAAVALAGVEASDVRVGDVLASPGAARPTRRLSARVHHLAGRSRPLRNGAKASLHLGTRAVEAGLTLFEVDEIPPGESALATLRLAEPVACLPGQRFILRGFDAPGRAGRTLGGGAVLDPEPGRRRRRDPDVRRVLAYLEARVEAPDDLDPAGLALLALAEEAGPRGLDLDVALRRLGLGKKRAERLLARKDLPVIALPSEGRLVATSALDALAPALVDALRRHHEAQPHGEGATLGELGPRLGRSLTASVVERAARRAVEAGALELAPGGYRLPGFRPQGDRAQAEAQLVAHLEAAGLEPPSAVELGPALGLDPTEVKTALGALARAGRVVHAGQGLYFARSALDHAGERIRSAIEADGPIGTGDAKKLFGLSRKYLIPLLETLDRLGVTARRGEVRVAR